MTGDTSTRFQRWYAKNRDKLNAKRRKRYASDPEYRRRSLEGSKISRRKSMEEPQGDPWDSFTILEDGKRYYRPGILCRIINRVPSTLRLWEEKGWVPLVTDESGEYRWYTRKQILLVQELSQYLDAHPREFETESFHRILKKIRKHWS